MDSYFLWDYTSDEIRALAPECVAIQPVASVEQHGPHLPLGTDSMIVEEFARRCRERFQKENYPALFLPLLAYGQEQRAHQLPRHHHLFGPDLHGRTDGRRPLLCPGRVP